MKKYELRPETGEFVIDPKHLPAGLAAAATSRPAIVRITALDYRSTGLEFDPAAFANHRWIRGLVLDDDLSPRQDTLECLYELSDLRDLNLTEWMPLDFSRFRKLTSLVLSRGSALNGLDKIRSLRQLMLCEWQGADLPSGLPAITASELRISVASKLGSVASLADMRSLRRLTLQQLPRLREIGKHLALDQVEYLNIEKIACSDFAGLSSRSLLDLELFTSTASLGFIRQLPRLRRLYIWECRDGDMRPVLDHPALTEIYLDKNRRHYSHSEKALQAQLAQARHPPAKVTRRR